MAGLPGQIQIEHPDGVDLLEIGHPEHSKYVVAQGAHAGPIAQADQSVLLTGSVPQVGGGVREPVVWQSGQAGTVGIESANLARVGGRGWVADADHPGPTWRQRHDWQRRGGRPGRNRRGGRSSGHWRGTGPARGPDRHQPGAIGIALGRPAPQVGIDGLQLPPDVPVGADRPDHHSRLLPRLQHVDHPGGQPRVAAQPARERRLVADHHPISDLQPRVVPPAAGLPERARGRLHQCQVRANPRVRLDQLRHPALLRGRPVDPRSLRHAHQESRFTRKPQDVLDTLAEIPTFHHQLADQSPTAVVEPRSVRLGSTHHDPVPIGGRKQVGAGHPLGAVQRERVHRLTVKGQGDDLPQRPAFLVAHPHREQVQLRVPLDAADLRIVGPIRRQRHHVRLPVVFRRQVHQRPGFARLGARIERQLLQQDGAGLRIEGRIGVPVEDVPGQAVVQLRQRQLEDVRHIGARLVLMLEEEGRVREPAEHRFFQRIGAVDTVEGAGLAPVGGDRQQLPRRLPARWCTG